MLVGSGNNAYEWNDAWAKIPNQESAAAGWSHHGVVVTEAGHVITLHQGDLTMLAFDKDGGLLRSWPLGLNEAHGMTLVKEGDTEYLVDCGQWTKEAARRRLRVPSRSEASLGSSRQDDADRGGSHEPPRARPGDLPGGRLHANVGCGQRRASWRQRRRMGSRRLRPNPNPPTDRDGRREDSGRG